MFDNTPRINGHNPDDVTGIILAPREDTKIHVAPRRALEVLDVTVGDKHVMWLNPKGHLAYRRGGGLEHIEAFFTAGPENVGGPSMGLPLHGSFSLTPAKEWEPIKTDRGDGVEGLIDVTDMVRGPYMTVHRKVIALTGKAAFVVEDTLEAQVGSMFMFLYHPNFPVQNRTQLVANPTVVVARDLISNCDIERYNIFENVGEGLAGLPATQPNGRDFTAVRRENFERAYVMKMQPDDKGDIYVMLVSPDLRTAAYVRYNTNDFMYMQQAFQFWKNPRGGSSGLEVGSTFMGREYASQHDLECCLNKGQKLTYRIEVGFLTNIGEVRDFIAAHNLGTTKPEIIEADGDGPNHSHSKLFQYYK